MRRLAIALLSLVEAGIACGIFASALELSRDIRRSDTVGRVAHEVVASTRQLAFAVGHHLRRLA